MGADWHFNPRSPHGERQAEPSPEVIDQLISIHAPRTGSDKDALNASVESYNFNPRSPHGERQKHPIRFVNSTDISIHAPRTGSDRLRTHRGRKADEFQSTLPARGATCTACRQATAAATSNHAPRTGSDSLPIVIETLKHISIHAPRTGSDGHRQQAASGVHISIHAPRTGSDTFALGAKRRWKKFQSTLPARGATAGTIPCSSSKDYFNPRSPHGERHITSASGKSPKIFQSTLPARGATQLLDWNGIKIVISIHAPRTGSDSGVARYYIISVHFNPRSPHGERQRKVTILSIRIIGFAQKVYHKTVLLRISLAENAVILPKRPRNPVRTSLQKDGGLRFARAIRAAHPYSISSPSGA